LKNGKPITAESFKDAGIDANVPFLATKAYEAINESDGGKGAEEHAIERANGMKEEYGDGVSTLLTIYNAIGLTLRLRDSYNEDGHFFKYAADPNINNGEWCSLLHVHPQAAALGSSGMLCYSLVDSEKVYNESIVLVIGWYNGYSSRGVARCQFTNSKNYDNANRATIGRALSGTAGRARRAGKLTTAFLV
jgi:hypothetical protein